MDIKKEVNYLIESCGSTELASLVKETGAYIIDNIDLPKSTLGMTVRSDGQTAILISSNVKGPKKEFIIAHELGHNILHRGQSTTFLGDFLQVYRFHKLKQKRTNSLYIYCCDVQKLIQSILLMFLISFDHMSYLIVWPDS